MNEELLLMGAGDILVGMEMSQGFPGNTTGKEPICQCRGCKKLKFHPWVRKVPWKRTGQPAPVFSPGKFHGQRSLAAYSPWGCKELDMTEVTHTHTHTHTHTQSVIRA